MELFDKIGKKLDEKVSNSKAFGATFIALAFSGLCFIFGKIAYESFMFVYTKVVRLPFIIELFFYTISTIAAFIFIVLALGGLIEIRNKCE